MIKIRGLLFVILIILVLSISVFAGPTEKNKDGKFSKVIGALKTKTSLIFNFPDSNVKTTVLPEGTYLIYNKFWLNKTEKDRQIHPPNRNNTKLEFNRSEPKALQLELIVDGFEIQNNLKLTTSRIENLATKGGRRDCLVDLGNETYKCRIEKVDTVFGGFLKDGTPTFAIMNVTFKKISKIEDKKR